MGIGNHQVYNGKMVRRFCWKFYPRFYHSPTPSKRPPNHQRNKWGAATQDTESKKGIPRISCNKKEPAGARGQEWRYEQYKQSELLCKRNWSDRMCARGIEMESPSRVNRDTISVMCGTQHHVNKVEPNMVSTTRHQRTDCNDALTQRHPGSTLSLWILLHHSSDCLYCSYLHSWLLTSAGSFNKSEEFLFWTQYPGWQPLIYSFGCWVAVWRV